MLPTSTPATAPHVVKKESEGERLAHILERLRQQRKRIIVIINSDGSMLISRAENEGSFPPLQKT